MTDYTFGSLDPESDPQRLKWKKVKTALSWGLEVFYEVHGRNTVPESVPL
jgi:hypothetical protein